MKQLRLSSIDDETLQLKTRKTKTERVTERLETLVPWSALIELIKPCYFVSGRRGRQPYDLELMLRIHLLQVVYNMSDPQMEDFLLENHTARKFVGLMYIDRTPDETTILHFRHFLEKHDFGKKIFELINERFNEAGLTLCKGRIIDASFIESPTSTKNRTHSRDPEMASGKKGNTWHFGMKMHIATDECIGLATNAVYGPANEHDIVRARDLISEETEDVYGDAGYLGIDKREEFKADDSNPNRQYWINQRPGKLKLYSPDDAFRVVEHMKSSIRCKVEHVFARIKLQMGYRKTRYRGIQKNAHRINTMLALANLFTWDCWRRRVLG